MSEATNTADPPASQGSDANASSSDERVHRWQSRLLPYLLGFVILLTLFFLGATFYQLLALNSQIAVTPDKTLIGEFDNFDESAAFPAIDNDARYRWRTLCMVEAYTIDSRYRLAAALLMTRVWLKYLGFLTGMTLALVGAMFILAKLREEASKFQGETAQMKFALLTTSPGLVLATLGTVLMIFTMSITVPIETTDAPTYLATWGLGPQRPSGATDPPPDFNGSTDTDEGILGPAEEKLNKQEPKQDGQEDEQ